MFLCWSLCWRQQDLLSIYRILSLYLKKDLALLLSPLPLAAAFAQISFYYGGKRGEICLPFLLAGFYLILRYFKEEYPEKAMDGKTLLFGGLLAGMVANIKFTVLGFFFAMDDVHCHCLSCEKGSERCC